MKKILFILFLPLSVTAQQGIELYGAYHQPIYAPLNALSKDLKSQGHKTELSNYSAGLKVKLYKNKRISLYTGLEYKYLKLKIDDLIDSITYRLMIPYNPSYYLENHTYVYKTDKPDINMLSHRIALSTELRVNLLEKKHYSHEIGSTFNLSFFEYYKTFYSSKELDSLRNNFFSTYQIQKSDEQNIYLTGKDILKRNIFLSAIDLNLFYQFNWIVCEQFSVGLRASIGTNLYSDWNQFKKYMWVGFGLHIGFLKDEKVRLNRKTPMDYGEHAKK